jgi:hypothetical protein
VPTLLIVPRSGRAIEVHDDPMVQLEASNDYLREYATRGELVDTARVFALNLDAFAAGCRRLLLVPPVLVVGATGELQRWAVEVLPEPAPRDRG